MQCVTCSVIERIACDCGVYYVKTEVSDICPSLKLFFSSKSQVTAAKIKQVKFNLPLSFKQALYQILQSSSLKTNVLTLATLHSVSVFSLLTHSQTSLYSFVFLIECTTNMKLCQYLTCEKLTWVIFFVGLFSDRIT